MNYKERLIPKLICNKDENWRHYRFIFLFFTIGFVYLNPGVAYKTGGLLSLGFCIGSDNDGMVILSISMF